MKHTIDYTEARDRLTALINPVDTEKTGLEDSFGRILAFQLTARENVPAFDRSPYDGYAFRAEDTAEASPEHPAVLKILEEVPAGSVPTMAVTKGTAVKILTGAPIPEGADAVIMYEKTEYTAEEVRISAPSASGDNIVRAGEDVRAGQVLAEPGTLIDPGLAGTLAAQGIADPLVYRKPVIGLISTGSELVDLQEEVPNGKIRNTNRYTLAAALQKDGCRTCYLGTAGDRTEEIAALISKGFQSCDMIVITGGVSAGDYDLTPDAMEMSGCEIIAKGVNLKPGMACCYGIKDSTPVCALSGNPSSSLINYYAVVRPAVRKLTGRRDYMPEIVELTLADEFKKKSKDTRILKGKLEIREGLAMISIPKGQGNVMIGSTIGCDVMGVVPAGSGPLAAGTRLEGFTV